MAGELKPPPIPTTATRSTLILRIITAFLLLSPISSCSFTITNNCAETIWPATLAGAAEQLPATGFRLDPGQTTRIPAPAGWSGRIWGRTGCRFDGVAGAGKKCETGDCGGRMECAGRGPEPPVTLFEVTLGGDYDFYDVSVVDGYNLPVVAAPRGVVSTNGSCLATGCVADLNRGCPKELQMEGNGGDAETTNVVACKSACEAFKLDQYCCTGEFANPTSCKPSFYSSLFKNACPRAYSYAFDDGTSIFTCKKASDYSLIFCPTINGLRNTGGLHADQQPIQEDHKYEETHKEATSKATALFIPYYYLLIIILLR